MLPPESVVRVAREQAYWDEAYRSTGSEHHRYLWCKHIEGKSYIGEYFQGLAAELRQRSILSLGGGVDRLGVRLAKAGNEIVTVDVSPVAAAATVDLAKQQGVACHVRALVGLAEEIPLAKESFDVVSKRALHHMDIARTVMRVQELLVAGGLFLAEEPMCLLRVLRWIHQKLPFHPNAPRTSDERELTPADLALIRGTFGEVKLDYFDFMTRESVSYLLDKARMEWLLRPLGKLDHRLINHDLPILRCLGSYVVIEARK
jgi:hypothetical protein